MNRRIRLTLLFLVLILLAGCGGGSGDPSAEPAEPAFRQSALWSLGERYGSEYSRIRYFLAYQKDGEAFCIQITRSDKTPASSASAIETREDRGVVCTLKNASGMSGSDSFSYTAYECSDGAFLYRIGQEKNDYRVEDVLSFDEAISLVLSPETPPDGIVLTERNWNAYFRTASCNLELLICVDDGGALAASLSDSYVSKTEDGETYFVSDYGNTIVWTDGTNSVEIRQANRTGADPVSYNTLSECREVLALLGSK